MQVAIAQAQLSNPRRPRTSCRQNAGAVSGACRMNSWRGGNVRRWTVDSERWYSHVNVDNEQWEYSEQCRSLWRYRLCGRKPFLERVYFQKALMDMAATMNSWEGTQHASSGVLLYPCP